MPERATTADLIRAARERAGLTQEQLGARLGLSNGTAVSHWESGSREPSLRSLRKIAAVLVVRARDLVGD